jgi:hypothetical protein
MKTTQPPITNDQELAGYRAGTEKLEGLIRRHEDDLMAERQAAEVDVRKVNQIRYTLRRLYAYHQGIMEAIEVYVRQRQHSA